MDNNIGFRHTYLIFRKLKEANFLFAEWSDIIDHNSMNNVIRDFYIENNNEVKRLRLYDNVDLIELSVGGYKFVFMDTDTRHPSYGPSKHLIILVNFFPVGKSYPKNEQVAVMYEKEKRYQQMREELDYFKSPNELVEVNGDLYEIEGSSEVFEFTKREYLINTHEAFCKYCDLFYNGQLRYEANRDMWEDFTISISPWDIQRRKKSKGYYEFVEIGNVKIITDFGLEPFV